MSDRKIKKTAKRKVKKPKKKSKFPGKAKSAPVALVKRVKTGRPRMIGDSRGGCVVRHYEYVSDVVAADNTPSDFKVDTYAVNPGIPSTFPWLSTIARNYESYVIEKLRFIYEPTAPTSVGGTVVLALDYDAADPAPGDKSQAMAYASSVRSSPWLKVSHVSNSSDLKKFKTNYVRVGPQPTGTDIKTYDVGNLFVISQGVSTAGAAIGELYVEYSIRFMTPQALAPVSPTVGGSISGTTGMVNSHPLGTDAKLPPTNYGFSYDNKTGIITLEQPGTYYFNYNGIASSITGTNFDDMKGATAYHENIVISGTHVADTWVITTTIVNALIHFFLLGATSITSSEAHIAKVPDGST